MQLLCLGDGALHALGALGEHQLCAIGFHQVAALHAHGLRHGDDQAIFFGRSNGCQTDAGVAGGGLNNGAAGLQLAGLFCVLYNGLSNTVLHGTGRVKILQLRQNSCFQVVLFFKLGQLHQRGAANQVQDRFINCHDNNSLSNSNEIVGQIRRSALLQRQIPAPDRR